MVESVERIPMTAMVKLGEIIHTSSDWKDRGSPNEILLRTQRF